MITNWNEFYLTVKRMRQAQKQYFRTRERVDLVTSKEFEKEIDLAIFDREKRNGGECVYTQKELF